MKDKKKTKTIPRQVRWDKLDNTAHLFPSIAGESMTNVYRISVTLKEEVQVEFLQQALDMILPKFDGFNLRMRTGVFWYYFEEFRMHQTQILIRQLPEEINASHAIGQYMKHFQIDS